MRRVEQREPRWGIAGLGDRAWPIGLAGLAAARGLVHDCNLMCEAQVTLASRWFIGYGLHEALPGHFQSDPDSAALGPPLPADLSAHG
jgi:hypothetical protein